jgi:hypothetical protein
MMMEFDPKKKSNIAESRVEHWGMKRIAELSAGVYLMPDSWTGARFCSASGAIS